ncbi:MAG: FecR family protein [Flectobacillus sp.]|uniref:FecR family protein n=1 Tax=Flectobacillus sp. TaxID=50419 RepID=UPI003B9920D1
MESNQPNIEQFLSNSTFVKWVKEPDDVSNEFWNNWLLNNPDKKETFELAKSIIQNLAYKHQYHLDKQELDAMFESIKSTVAQNSETEKLHTISIFKNNIKRFWWVAASVVIGIIYSFQTEFTKERLMTSVLTLGNKQFYGANPGERIKVILPDGSIVTLQGGSSITYNSDFQDSIRKVELNGQAFFEVVKNPQKPFVVQSKHLRTRVLGTSFCVNDFEKDVTGKVAVRTGKVSMSVVENDQSEILTPSKMGVWHEAQKQIEVSSFDLKSELAWKDNILYFSKEDMPSVLSKIEAWYGVKITVDSSLKLKGRYSGEFYDESLENVLTGVGFTSGFDFEINGKEVRITPNR